MTADEFIANWRDKELTERQGSQSHFNDLCSVLGHKKPTDSDAEEFTFEKHVRKELGGKGFADVWMKGHFGWEYKGEHKDLVEAYQQLLQYRQDLGNPRLLVVCDMKRFIIHTAFNDAEHRQIEIQLTELNQPDKLEILHQVFSDPDKLNPNYVEHPITEEAATHIAQIAESIRARGIPSKEVAHFLDRIVFCMFAQNIGLLSRGVFSEIATASIGDPKIFAQYVGDLFAAMATGGKNVLLKPISHFNGNLFDGSPVLELTLEEIKAVESAAALDWKKVDATIFGTLFVRGMDPALRAQLGAQYTSRADILAVVEPVIMQPLRREWRSIQEKVKQLLSGTASGSRKKAEKLLVQFLERLRTIKILDPACGSGNFLFVTLQLLLELEREVSRFAGECGFTGFLPHVSPLQLYGIEVNSYAHDLAQMTVLIGYIQWLNANGYGQPAEPILQRLDKNFFCKDAILDQSDPEHPKEAEWPDVDFVVSNPPFLGSKKMRRELDKDAPAYVDKLFSVWKNRVSQEADLCCYWFEKARKQIQDGHCQRAGLLATQGIRGGANREVLKRIKETGDIFFAESDRDWLLDGASVHVSMIGFDNGRETEHVLDGKLVPTINADLTAATTDITEAKRLPANLNLSFMGTTKGGSFDIPEALAEKFLRAPNPNGKPNSDVVVPWVNGLDVTRRLRRMWIIDFGIGLPEQEAAKYEAPFEYVRQHVKPEREMSRTTIAEWWLHERRREDMRVALAPLPRFICTCRVSKHRTFVWLAAPTLPDSATFAFARSDDYFFGVLHSRAHEVWALKLGTRLETRPRYTPTTCFETFPLPIPTEEQQAAIAAAAKELDRARVNWLNPAEWMREEVLEFPASATGPWRRYVKDGAARYPRLMPKDADCAKKLAKQTLTNLYNRRPQWLTDAHRKLDEAVFAAYGWSVDISDGQILEKLLALNAQQAGA